MGSYFPVMNESINEMIYEMNHTMYIIIYRTVDMKSSFCKRSRHVYGRCKVCYIGK